MKCVPSARPGATAPREAMAARTEAPESSLEPQTISAPDPPAEGLRPGVRRQLATLAILFTGTGCSALLAEQAFEKLLSTLLGASTPAAATVLAMYFAGLTLGGLLYGKARSLVRNPLRTYALLEAIVGLWALLLSLGFGRLIPLFVPMLALGRDRFWLLELVRLFVAACWILPATIPMGASFPAIVDALKRMAVPSHGRMMSRYYSWNLLGAILAAFLGPFLLFPKWGVDGTLLFAFGVNATVCLVATAMAARLDPISAVDEPRRPLERLGREPSPGLLLLVTIAALSGFLFFALEVVWTHLVGTVLGNSVYAFAAMLAAVLVGLGLGGALTTLRFAGKSHIPAAELGNLFLAGAALVAITSSQWPAVPDTLTRLGAGINSFGQAETLRWITALILIVPPSTALGMVYPTLFRLPVFPRLDPAAAAGRLVAANSVGCIAGALAAGFGLIPTLGSETTLRALTLLAVLLAALFCARFLTGSALRKRLLLAAAIAVAVAASPRWDRLRLTNGKQVYFFQGEVGRETRLVSFHEDTLGGFTTVVDNPVSSGEGQPSYRRTLLTNGKFQGNDAHEMDAQTGIALVPAMFVPRCERALNIGLGTGRTAYVLRALGFPRVDIAEIAPGIVAAAERDFRHINGSVLQDPGTRLFLEDGRNVLLLQDTVYDLITIEISSIWFAGSTNLFSREFYAGAIRRLSPEGVLQQWVQIHHITLRELGTAITTLRSVFPYVSFWVVGGQGLMVASRQPQRITARFLEAIQNDPARIGWSRGELEERLRTIVSSRILSPADTTRLVASGRYPLNTDGNRRLEYETPRYNHVHVNFGKRNLRALKELASFPPPEVAPEASGRLAEVCRRIAREQYLKTLGLEPAPRRRR